MRTVRFLFPLLLMVTPAALAEEPVAAYQKLLTPLLVTGETMIGQPIAYPAGKAKVTAAMVVIAPGKETGWHTHAVPLFAYVLDGELTVDYGSKGVQGLQGRRQRLIEAMNWPHNGMNKGDRAGAASSPSTWAPKAIPTATPAPGAAIDRRRLARGRRGITLPCARRLQARSSVMTAIALRRSFAAGLRHPLGDAALAPAASTRSRPTRSRPRRRGARCRTSTSAAPT